MYAQKNFGKLSRKITQKSATVYLTLDFRNSCPSFVEIRPETLPKNHGFVGQLNGFPILPRKISDKARNFGKTLGNRQANALL